MTSVTNVLNEYMGLTGGGIDLKLNRQQIYKGGKKWETINFHPPGLFVLFC